MPALDGMTGIVVGSIIGSVFVITCIISAIKAVRDRSRIKTRISVREKEKLEKDYANEKKYSNIEDITPTSQYVSNTCQPSCSGNNRLSNDTTCSSGSVEHLDLSVYSIGAGVDNLTFQHSNTNIQYHEETHHVSSQILTADVETVPFCQNLVQKRAQSQHAHSAEDRNVGNNSTDSLSAETIMRRHTYEIAVCENSWFPLELNCDPPSQAILGAFDSKKILGNSTKAVKVAFENKAYDTDENKIS